MRGKFLFSLLLLSTAVQTPLLSYLSITRIGRVPQKLVCGDKRGVKRKAKCCNYLGQHFIRDHTSAALEWMNRWDVLQSSQQREREQRVKQPQGGKNKKKTHWAGTSWSVSDWCYTRRESDCGANKTHTVLFFFSLLFIHCWHFWVGNKGRHFVIFLGGGARHFERVRGLSNMSYLQL